MAQIKSKERVRDLAEVYTNEREVKAMLDLIPIKKPDDIIRYRYLEPACGNGNFLIEILRRKLVRVNEKYANQTMSAYEFHVARAVTTIYGIDICQENVLEARERLYREIKSSVDMHKGSFVYSAGFFSFIRYVLDSNVVRGDSINNADSIEFIEFITKGKRFERRVFNFAHLASPKPLPVRIFGPENFLLIGLNYQARTGCDDERIQRHFDFV